MTHENGSSSNNRPFDLADVHDYFCDALLDDQKVHLKHYLEAWRELTRFLDTLGTLFHFVTHDVKSKIHILESYLAENEANYLTINSVLTYEVENKLTKTKKPSGSRTILRLHRALNFILLFFEKLVEADLTAKCSQLSTEAYNITLGKYHPWIVRKAATLAMYSLPTKEGLLTRIDPSDGAEERVTGLLQRIAEAGRPIYDLTETMYAKDNLLDLP